jgi:lipopolysaccharide/colanic/teichoic acid biosynthesis glycosyltransferase
MGLRRSIVTPVPGLPTSGRSTKVSEPHLTIVRENERVVTRRRRGWYEAWGKRSFDLAVTAAILFVLAPIMLVVWLVLRVTLGPDVVITQDRVGMDGATFGMYKFRTMKWSRRGRAEPFDGPDRRIVHKTDSDPRHTPVGRAFRKASLDELPQLLNVLAGDMSLVGPRPELASIIDRIDERGHRRHTVRPGMTGEWQITGRQDGRLLHECLDEDLPYLDRITLRNDLGILVKTVSVVTGRGGR